MLRCEFVFSVLIQYLGAYTLALWVIIRPMFIESRLRINEVLVKSYKSKILIYLIGFFSLGGSPPFLGFYAKVAVAQIILVKGQLFYLMFLVRRSVFLLYVYMRFFYQAIVASNTEVETNAASHFYGSAIILVLRVLIGFPWL